MFWIYSIAEINNPLIKVVYLNWILMFLFSWVRYPVIFTPEIGFLYKSTSKNYENLFKEIYLVIGDFLVSLFPRKQMKKYTIFVIHTRQPEY